MKLYFLFVPLPVRTTPLACLYLCIHLEKIAFFYGCSYFCYSLSIKHCLKKRKEIKFQYNWNTLTFSNLSLYYTLIKLCNSLMSLKDSSTEHDVLHWINLRKMFSSIFTFLLSSLWFSALWIPATVTSLNSQLSHPCNSGRSPGFGFCLCAVDCNSRQPQASFVLCCLLSNVFNNCMIYFVSFLEFFFKSVV